MSKLTQIAVIGLLALLSAIVAAETPDQCAARLDLDIRVETFAQATAWYEQVQRECATEPEGEGLLRLELETPTTLTVTECLVWYGEATNFDDVYIYPRVFQGNAKMHWRHGHAGKWQQLQQGAIQIVTGGGPEGQFIPFEWPEIIGGGFHQFELRTRDGADKFEILETWAAFYILDIYC